MKNKIQTYESETAENVAWYNKALEERDIFIEELGKMKQHMDPSSISLNDIMRKLRAEDPANFRQVMSDLEYQGKDPTWYQQEFMEALG